MMDMCHTSYCQSLVHLVAHTMSEAGGAMDLSFLQYGTSVLPNSRNLLAVRALEMGATHILWIDSDMEFPPDMLLRFARHDLPIIASNCMARRSPYMITARDADNNQIHTTQESTGVEKVSRLGFGVVWTAAQVFREIEMPYFELHWLPDKHVFGGEDFAFCDKAKAAGFELHIDHDISKEVKHMGLFGYHPLLKPPEGQT